MTSAILLCQHVPWSNFALVFLATASSCQALALPYLPCCLHCPQTGTTVGAEGRAGAPQQEASSAFRESPSVPQHSVQGASPAPVEQLDSSPSSSRSFLKGGASGIQQGPSGGSSRDFQKQRTGSDVDSRSGLGSGGGNERQDRGERSEKGERGEQKDTGERGGRGDRAERGDRGVAQALSVPQELPEPKPIRWRKGELIGAGAYGSVYMGMNLESGELIAVKQVGTLAMQEALGTSFPLLSSASSL